MIHVDVLRHYGGDDKKIHVDEDNGLSMMIEGLLIRLRTRTQCHCTILSTMRSFQSGPQSWRFGVHFTLTGQRHDLMNDNLIDIDINNEY